MSESEFPSPDMVTVGEAVDRVLRLRNDMQERLAAGDYETAADTGVHGVQWAKAVAEVAGGHGDVNLIRALVVALQTETATAEVARGDVEAALGLLSDLQEETEVLRRQLGTPTAVTKCQHGLPSFTGSCMRSPCPPTGK